jgi:hypothetical protein
MFMEEQQLVDLDDTRKGNSVLYFQFVLFHIDSRFVARPFIMTNPSYIFFFYSVLIASRLLHSHDLETAQNGIYSALSSSFHNLRKGLLYGAIKALCFG